MIFLMLNPGLSLEECDIADVEPRTQLEECDIADVEPRTRVVRM